MFETLGEPQTTWTTYAVSGEDLPALTALILDADAYEADEPACYAPLHALRAIGQLGDLRALPALIEVLGRNLNPDQVWQDMPQVFVLLGPATVDALAEALADYAPHLYAGIGTFATLKAVVDANPETHDRYIEILTAQLQQAAENDAEVNARIIKALTEHDVRAALPLIEAAYKAERVDKFIAGDWASVQETFGEKDPDPDAGKTSMEIFKSLGDDFKETDQRGDDRQAAKRKRRRKIAKKSRKKNRR
jgi:hypothetical protein